MQNFEDAFKTCKRSFITTFSVCMTVPLSKTFDDLEHLLKCITKVSDIVAVSETRIFKKTLLTSHIELQNYSFEFTPTESSAGGTLLYTATAGIYLYRKFWKNQYHCVSCFYKHPNRDVSVINKNYSSTLLDKLSKGNKQVFLLADFDFNLLK